MSSHLPKISNVSEKSNILHFRMTGVDGSFANAIRRTIMTDIPVMGFTIDTIHITKNTCMKMHNQVLQSRMENIPILLDPATIPDTYELILDVTNTSNVLRQVTTADFQVINLKTQKNESDNLRVWFPQPFPLLCLQGRVSDAIMGESIHLTCRPQLVMARANACYKAGEASCYPAPDPDKIASELPKVEDKLKKEGLTPGEVANKIQDWKILEGARLTLPNTYEFIVESFCFYNSRKLVSEACSLLAQQVRDFIITLNKDRYLLHVDETKTLPNAWEMQLSDMDESLANILTHYLYEKYFQGDKSLTYCACSRLHPYHTYLTLCLAFANELDTATHVKEKLETCAQIALPILEHLSKSL